MSNNQSLYEQPLDELEQITHELRCLAKRSQKLKFGEISYLIGVAEESAKMSLIHFAQEELERSESSVFGSDLGAHVIPFPSSN